MNITNFGKKVSFKKTLDYCLPPSPRIFIPSLDLFSAKDVILKCACAISWVNVFLDLQFLQKWNEAQFTSELHLSMTFRELFFSQLVTGSYGKSGEVKSSFLFKPKKLVLLIKYWLHFLYFSALLWRKFNTWVFWCLFFHCNANNWLPLLLHRPM